MRFSLLLSVLLIAVAAFMTISSWQRGKREGMLFALSLGLVALVGIAIAGGALDLFIAILLSAAVATAFIRWLFPEAPFFSLTFANLIALYASIFSFFMQELFARIGPFVAGIGFSLPIHVLSWRLLVAPRRRALGGRQP
jgi:hypothetical protein